MGIASHSTIPVTDPDARYTAVSNKEMYFIMTAAVGNKDLLERTLESFRGFTACLTGTKEKGAIDGTGAWNKGDIKKSPTMSQAYENGQECLEYGSLAYR